MLWSEHGSLIIPKHVHTNLEIYFIAEKSYSPCTFILKHGLQCNHLLYSSQLQIYVCSLKEIWLGCSFVVVFLLLLFKNVRHRLSHVIFLRF